MIKVTLEFESADQAIVALGKLVGAPLKVASGSASKDSAAQAPGAPTTTRRGRSDKGQPRGSYKVDATTQAAAQGTEENRSTLESAQVIGKGGDSSVSSSTPVAAAPQTAAATPVEGDKPQPPGTTSPAAVPKIEDAQASIAKVFNEKKIDVAMQVLSRFGVKAVRELKSAQYAEFIQKCDDVLAGGAV